MQNPIINEIFLVIRTLLGNDIESVNEEIVIARQRFS
jgi:hypothetical protein